MKTEKFASQIPQLGLSLTSYEGKEVLVKIGEDVIRDVIVSILCGGNVRTLTESLTQRRLMLSNGAMIVAYLQALSKIPAFKDDPLNFIKTELKNEKLKREEKIFMNWLLGLTGKSIQNVLRNDAEENLDFHTEMLTKAINDASSEIVNEIGKISGKFTVNSHVIHVELKNLLHLFLATGTQTLAIRGSEKSMYGKLFEKLILGTLLTILDFEFIDPKNSHTTTHKTDK